MKKSHLSLTSLLGSVTIASANFGFEGLNFTSGNFENGANLSGTSIVTNNPFGGSGSLVTTSSTFRDSFEGNTATFANTYNAQYSGLDGTGAFQFDFWNQWAYSQATDTVTSGIVNQYSAITGSGAAGSSNYAVAFRQTQIDFENPFDFRGRGIEVTNTTYAHNSIRDGDLFAKRFGGASGTDPDFFRLTIEGFLGEISTGSLTFDLANFESPNPAEDYILDEWAFVNLTALGAVDQLSFALSSSDVGNFGINTPEYFAIDNIGVIPEPSVFTLFLGALSLFLSARRRSRNE